MKKRLLLVLVLGISFAPPAFGSELGEKPSLAAVFQTAAAGVNCKSDLRAKRLPAEVSTGREARTATAHSARQ